MTNDDKKKETRDISDLLETFGKYQIIQYMLICLPIIFVAMISINFVFTVGDVDYRCQIDECEEANSTAEFPIWWPETTRDRCSRPVLSKGVKVCSNSSFTGELATCDHWIYENNNTVIAELNLACQPWKSNLIGTFHNLGMSISIVVTGWMSDRFGRKPTLIFCVSGGIIGQIKTIATSYYMYIGIEFLEACVVGGSYAVATVILLEIAGKRYRVLAGVLFSYTVYFGEVLFVCIAMLVPYWKTLIHIINGPSIFSILLFFLINESPRWQIVSGRVESAKTNLKRIAKDNKICISNEELENIDEDKLKEKFDIKSYEIKENYIDAFKSKEITKRLFVACICQFTSNFVYYGIMINSVWLPGDKHLNFLLSSLMSFPGEIISLYLMNKVGRKIPLQAGFLTCGLLCIISVLIPTEYSSVKLSVVLLAKVVISACYTGAITFAMELFPTSVRGSLFGLALFTAEIGGMLAPLTPILNNISNIVPFMFFGCATIIAGVLLYLAPETKDMPLYDTIEQMKNSGITKVETKNNNVITDVNADNYI
ncbi:unnamed protein product [Arctia plantaginis]|uniref:Major facilitator superfamily (MFS) profile domain-containing protein n=1 Tax=Arctia plantaginis TaxID=874455 RepID=A0A8S0ZBS6_ARCPL|nr:unnamed protein product [Arctia plantaginis]